MTRRPAFAVLLVLACAVTSGCSDDKTQTTATLRVHAHLTSTRPTSTGSTTFHVPLRENVVLAVRSDGKRIEGATDRYGLAVLHLEPGEYAVTAPSAGCVTKHVTITAAEVIRLQFNCLAP